MAMVGFSFTKINAERKVVGGSAVNVESNAGVTNVIELPVIDPKKTVLKFEFIFSVKYGSESGKIDLNGEIIHMYDKDFASRILDQWKKDKKIIAEVMPEVFNVILARSNIEALIISRDLGLPSPIQLPRVNVKPKDKADKPAESKPASKKK